MVEAGTTGLHTNFPTDLSCGDMGLSRRDDVALSQQKQIVLIPI
jgi:hypothetical protein